MRPKRKLIRLIASLPDRIGRPPTRTPYIPQIDGLQFLAIALVLVWHSSLRASRFVDVINDRGEHAYSLYGWFPHGEIGVALFFFISGFVIAQPFLSRGRAQWRIGQFYLRRLRRIYPPYFVAITLCFLIVAITGFGDATSNLSATQSWAASLFYLNGLLYDTSSRVDPPIWSLEVEIQFYLLAPFLIGLYLLPQRMGTRLAIGGLAAVACILGASFIDLIHPFDGRFRFGLPAHMYLFVAGIVTADAVRMRNTMLSSVSAGFDALFVAGVLLLLGLGLYLTQVDAKPGGGWPDILCDFGELVAVLAIYFGATQGRISRRIMGTPWIALVGTMCFSIYLVHVVVIQAVASRFLNHLPLHHVATIWSVYMVVLLPLSLLVGGVYFVIIERPFMTANPFRAVKEYLPATSQAKGP